MKRFLVALLVAAPLAASAQQWNWTEHAYPENGFRVEFNGPVSVRTMPLDEKARKEIARGTQYMLEGDDHVYLVAASLNKVRLNFTSGVEQSFAGLKCGATLSDRAVEAGTGRELHGERCIDGTYEAEVRYLRSGLWFYQVVALYKHKGGDAAAARYFLDSFRVTR